MKKEKLLSLIVPCFNEEESIPLFHKEISKTLKELNINYELLFVNDGSRDNTLEEIKALANKDTNVKYLSFSRNFGKESAMYAGLNNASGDYVGFIDADLQHPPILLKEMIEKLDSDEYDCVACRRVDRTGDSKIRTFFSRLFYKIINKISDAKMMDGAGDYRILKRNVVEAILSVPEYSRFSKGIFSWVGFNTYWIEYENVDRVAGKTSWSFNGLVKYAITGIVNFSNFPLTCINIIGLVQILVSFIYLLFNYSKENAGIIFALLFISAIQTFMIGIVGMYVGKIYSETKNRPHYIIRETNKADAIKIK